MHHSTSHTRNLVAKSSDSVTHGTMTVLEFSEQARAKRAGLMAAKCLGITAVCVLIPGAHFILVPLGLVVVTPLMTIYTFRVKTQIVSATIDCPKCHVPLNVLTTQEQYPMYENCSSCHRQITLTQAT